MIINEIINKSTNNIAYTTSLTYAYDTSLSPVITTISPSSGSGGSLTITGQGFGTDSSK